VLKGMDSDGLFLLQVYVLPAAISASVLCSMVVEEGMLRFLNGRKLERLVLPKCKV